MIFSHVDEVIVSFFGAKCDSLYLNGDEFAEKVDSMCLRQGNNLGTVVMVTYRECRDIIRRCVEEVGWENFKEVLTGKCEREYGNQEYPFHD